jgi:hypothetical protein
MSDSSTTFSLRIPTELKERHEKLLPLDKRELNILITRFLYKEIKKREDKKRC